MGPTRCLKTDFNPNLAPKATAKSSRQTIHVSTDAQKDPKHVPTTISIQDVLHYSRKSQIWAAMTTTMNEDDAPPPKINDPPPPAMHMSIIHTCDANSPPKTNSLQPTPYAILPQNILTQAFSLKKGSAVWRSHLNVYLHMFISLSDLYYVSGTYPSLSGT